MRPAATPHRREGLLHDNCERHRKFLLYRTVFTAIIRRYGKVMRAFIIVVSLFAFMFAAAEVCRADAKDVAIIPLAIKGMMCIECEIPIKRSIKRLDGVTRVRLDHVTGHALVSYDPSKVTPQQIIKAVERRGGYTAEVIEEE